MKTISIVAAVVFSIASTYPGRSVYAATTCPSPAPKCTSSSSATLKGLAGPFGCLGSGTKPNGIDKVSILLVTFDGVGHWTGKGAGNEDSASGNTFQDFSADSGTYCVNSDGTGYIFAGDSCPIAMVIDSAKSEIRLIETQENQAQSTICGKQ